MNPILSGAQGYIDAYVDDDCGLKVSKLKPRRNAGGI